MRVWSSMELRIICVNTTPLLQLGIISPFGLEVEKPLRLVVAVLQEL